MADSTIGSYYKPFELPNAGVPYDDFVKAANKSYDAITQDAQSRLANMHQGVLSNPLVLAGLGALLGGRLAGQRGAMTFGLMAPLMGMAYRNNQRNAIIDYYHNALNANKERIKDSLETAQNISLPEQVDAYNQRLLQQYKDLYPIAQLPDVNHILPSGTSISDVVKQMMQGKNPTTQATPSITNNVPVNITGQQQTAPAYTQAPDGTYQVGTSKDEQISSLPRYLNKDLAQNFLTNYTSLLNKGTEERQKNREFEANYQPDIMKKITESAGNLTGAQADQQRALLYGEQAKTEPYQRKLMSAEAGYYNRKPGSEGGQNSELEGFIKMLSIGKTMADGIEAQKDNLFQSAVNQGIINPDGTKKGKSEDYDTYTKALQALIDQQNLIYQRMSSMQGGLNTGSQGSSIPTPALPSPTPKNDPNTPNWDAAVDQFYKNRGKK